ncbi:MAG: phage major capsid protein [Aeromonas sp.]
MDLETINKTVESLNKGFAEFKSAHEQAQKDTSSHVQEKLDKITNDFASKFEKLQTDTIKLTAAMERGNVAEGAAKTDDVEGKAFKSYLLSGKEALQPEQVKALSTDSNPDGGYMVPTQMLGIINGRVFETSPLRALATVRQTANKSVTMDLDDGEAGGGWEGEDDNNNTETSNPQIGELEITAKKLFAEPHATIEDLQDSAFDMESWLAEKVADRFGRLENSAFVTGDGVSRPRGFLTYTAGVQGADYVRGSIEQIANGSTTAVTENGLIDLVGSLKEAYQPGAVLGMKRTTLVNIMKLAGSSNFRFLNLQPTGLPGQTGGVIKPGLTLLDKPVYLMDDMPAIASNALSVVYGDFKRGYMIVDRVGISVLRDIYTRKGRVKFYTTKRVGGAVTNFEALKLLRMA